MADAASSSELYMQTMCCCMPLRLGILLCSLLTLFSSLLYVGDQALFLSLFRCFTGGYSKASSNALAIIEVLGVLFGFLGVLGAWNTHRSYLMTYNFWQMARLMVWVFALYVDIPLVFQCEAWVDNVKKTADEHGWNQVLYDVAIHGDCPNERTRFLVLSTLTLVSFMYLVNCTNRYLEFLDREPRHLLRVPKDLSSGIFFARPTGDGSFLDDAAGDEEHGNWGSAAADGPQDYGSFEEAPLLGQCYPQQKGACGTSGGVCGSAAPQYYG